MNYKEKATILRVCSSRKGERCHRCPAFGQGNRACMRNAMKDGSKAIEDLLEKVSDTEKQLREAKFCVAALSLLLKAIDGKTVMETVLPMARDRLKIYREKYPSAKVVLDKSKEALSQ